MNKKKKKRRIIKTDRKILSQNFGKDSLLQNKKKGSYKHMFPNVGQFHVLYIHPTSILFTSFVLKRLNLLIYTIISDKGILFWVALLTKIQNIDVGRTWRPWN